jgi:hypothetical protein
MDLHTIGSIISDATAVFSNVHNYFPPTPSPTLSNASFSSMFDLIHWKPVGNFSSDTVIPRTETALFNLNFHMFVDWGLRQVNITYVSFDGYIAGDLHLSGAYWVDCKYELINSCDGVKVKVTAPGANGFRAYIPIVFQLM